MKKRFIIIAAICFTFVLYFLGSGSKSINSFSADSPVTSTTATRESVAYSSQTVESGNSSLSSVSSVFSSSCNATGPPDNAPLPVESTAYTEAPDTERPETPPTSTTVPRPYENEFSELKVHFIDVGQGDAIFIQCSGSTLLIDAGGESAGSKLRYYLTGLGVNRFDYVISTHPDADHIGSMDVILQNFDVDKYFQPDIISDTKQFEQVMYSLRYKNLKITPPVVGNTYILGDASFTIIAPNGDYGSSTNDWSIGILLIHGSNKFVFCGDCEKPAEADILKNGIDIDADVFKLSHHGSNTANTKEFIEAISPDSCVVCCGKDNPYGHPHAEVTDMLGEMGIDVYRTDEQGTVIACSDGKSITFNNAPYTVNIPENSASSAKPPETTPKQSTLKDDTLVTADYVLNTNTKKFHLPTCSSVEEIKASNKRFFSGTKEDILAMGYTPCKRCDP